MLIKELAYKFSNNDNLVIIPIQNESGVFIQDANIVRQGVLFTTEITAYVPGITAQLNSSLKKIASLGAIFQCKDTAGNIFTVGEEQLKASLQLEKKNEGKAGSKYGYELKITWNSANGAEFKSFQ